VKLHARTDGQTLGPTVVLHNSLGCALRMWDPQVPTLVDAGLRVLRYDYRGHGRSAAGPGPYTLADLGGDVVELMTSHGIERAVHVGLSLGGMVAMWLAENAPEAVTGLVLCSTSADLQPSAAWRDRARLVREKGTEPMAEVLVPRWFSPDYVAGHPSRIEEFREQILASSPEGFAGCCEAIASMDLLAGLRTIAVPTSVLVGRQDPGTPVPHAEQIAAAIPGAALTVLDPGSHLLNVERPGEVGAAVLDVVARAGGGAG
jgi:3-oxoadipate enol-lactonase